MAERTCAVAGCDRDASGKRGGGRGWCSTHYMRWRRHGDPDHGGDVLRQTGTGQPCDVDDCDRPVIARAYCEGHYRRFRRYGEPLAGRPSPGTPAAHRFWSKVDKTGDCWLWTDAPNSAGYGTFKVDGVTVMAHRFSWMLAGDELDPDLELDHLCRVRLCVRRDHLEQVTGEENKRRARLAQEALDGRLGDRGTPL